MLLLRIGALAVAAVTALLLVVGDHPAEFVVADTVLVLALVAAAVLPRRRGALVGLLAALGFAAGVFTVAFARSVVDGSANLPVGAGGLACVLGIAGAAALLTRGRPARPAT